MPALLGLGGAALAFATRLGGELDAGTEPIEAVVDAAPPQPASPKASTTESLHSDCLVRDISP
ncbi:MAG TPA: hypothetical protein VIR57_16335, partial [Chloroflexota bacterium]